MGRSRIGVVKDADFYKSWAYLHKFCQGCGVSAKMSPWPGNSTHHLVRFRRSDEATNLLRMCIACHSACEGLPWPGMPSLTIGMCLTIKACREPLDFDVERLRVLYGFGLPDMEPIPWAYESEFRRRRPKDFAAFDTKSGASTDMDV